MIVKADDTLSDEIDGAYRTKYRRYAANIVRARPHPASAVSDAATRAAGKRAFEIA